MQWNWKYCKKDLYLEKDNLLKEYPKMRKISVGGMNRPPKSTPMAKKVAPPAVPEIFRHSGSSFGSAGYASSEDGFIPLQEGQTNLSDGGDLYVVPGKSPNQYGYAAFTFPGKSAYYHQQQSLQEDQGIDMTQSPGRDSPGSSGSGSGSGSRHSTASLDSGRASGSHLLGTRTGSIIGSSPRCSISSSSIGSSEHGGPGFRVERMLQQGVPDHDIVNHWLHDIHFEEYYSLFVTAGYDMPTISKMTPEDLTAIGIKKPNHRKKLKAEITQLNISDGLPDYIPGSMEEWLRLLRLEEYIPVLRQQGYQTVEDVTQLAWEDLEETGVVKLGHQKRLMLAMKRIKDIRSGKRFPHLNASPNTHVTQAELHSPGPDYDCVDSDTHQQQQQQPPNIHTLTRSFHQPWEIESTRQLMGYTPLYCPDIVPITIRGGRGKSLESLEDGERTGTHHTFSPENTATFYYPALQLQSHGWRRSYDDGDLTPTNDNVFALHEGGGTLPRHRGPLKPRPVAKIPATRNLSYFEKQTNNYTNYDLNKFNQEPIKESELSSYDLQEKCIVPPSMPPISGVYDYKYRYTLVEPNNTLVRRRPPSPPKRQSSHLEMKDNLDCNIPKDNRIETVVELHNTANSTNSSSSLPLPNYDSNSEADADDLGGRLETLHLTWQNDTTTSAVEAEEQQLIAALAQQARNGSNASFNSSSSTESDSLPFANENAGTIKQRANRVQGNEYQISSDTRNIQEPADVLSDIGNMLANLTDELDAMLEEEKMQGLSLD